MRIIRAFLLGGAALAALAPQGLSGPARAGGTAVPDGVNVDQLATSAAPVLPPGSRLMTISKTPQPEVPGLPLSARDKAALGPTATTITILPATEAPADGAVSWSGYSRAGVVYHGN